MGLRRESQVGIKIEASEGVAETLVANDYGGERRESDISYSNENYQRDNDRGTMTKRPHLSSKHGGRLTFTEEMVGGAVGTAAPWHPTLRACGFAQSTSVVRILIDEATNIARRGDLVGNNAVQGSATKTFRVIHVDVAAKKVWLHQLSGSALNDGEVITNYSRTNSFTVDGAAVAAGYAFNPQSERDSVRPPSATVELRRDGQLHKLAGSRGNCTINWTHGRPVLLQAEFSGVPVTQSNTGTPIEPGSGITPPVVGGPPVVVQQLPMELLEGTGNFTPIAISWEVQMNNTVAMRGTGTDLSIYESGYLPCRITDRATSITLDPEHVKASEGFDFIGTLRNGKTFRFSSRAGLPSNINGAVVMVAPLVQLAGDYSPGDRDGITTSNVTLNCYGNNDDELYIYHIFDPA
jgi:hypothetical protein